MLLDTKYCYPPSLAHKKSCNNDERKYSMYLPSRCTIVTKLNTILQLLHQCIAFGTDAEAVNTVHFRFPGRIGVFQSCGDTVMVSFATAAQFYVDEASMTASVGTGDTVARHIRAALALHQEQLALGMLFALLADPGSSFQTPLIVLGQHAVHFAVASVVHTLRILHDAFVIAVAVLA